MGFSKVADPFPHFKDLVFSEIGGPLSCD